MPRCVIKDALVTLQSSVPVLIYKVTKKYHTKHYQKVPCQKLPRYRYYVIYQVVTVAGVAEPDLYNIQTKNQCFLQIPVCNGGCTYIYSIIDGFIRNYECTVI